MTGSILFSDQPQVGAECQVGDRLRIKGFRVVHGERIADVIPREACYLGWQESLRKLAKLVEPEINQ